MNEIIQSVDSSMSLMKLIGAALVLAALLCLFIFRNQNKDLELSWKEVVSLALFIGIINAGVSIVFGKAVFMITPIMLATVLLLWFLKKFPLSWKKMHILVFCSIFVTSSVVTFLGIGTLFFQLAVEGKFS